MWMVALIVLALLGVGFLAARRDRPVGRSTRIEGEGGRVRSVARLLWAEAGSKEGSLLLLGSAMLTGAVIVVATAWYLSDDLHCPVDGEESNYGEAEWSWFPIGTTCRWTQAQNGFDRVEQPGWLPTVLVGAMVGAGLSLVLASATAAGRRDDGPSVIP